MTRNEQQDCESDARPAGLSARIYAGLDHFFSAIGKYQPGCALPDRQQDQRDKTGGCDPLSKTGTKP